MQGHTHRAHMPSGGKTAERPHENGGLKRKTQMMRLPVVPGGGWATLSYTSTSPLRHTRVDATHTLKLAQEKLCRVARIRRTSYRIGNRQSAPTENSSAAQNASIALSCSHLGALWRHSPHTDFPKPLPLSNTNTGTAARSHFVGHTDYQMRKHQSVLT